MSQANTRAFLLKEVLDIQQEIALLEEGTSAFTQAHSTADDFEEWSTDALRRLLSHLRDVRVSLWLR